MKAEPAMQLPAQILPPKVVFFPAGPPAQPEGAALSLGNCTAQIPAPFLQCQLPQSPCFPPTAKVQGKTVNDFHREQEQALSAFPASAHCQHWLSHYLLTVGIQCPPAGDILCILSSWILRAQAVLWQAVSWHPSCISACETLQISISRRAG